MSTSAQALSIWDEIPVAINDGAVQWIPLRRRLGVEAFGTNAYRADKAGDVVIEEHVESPGQQELYIVVAGSARIVVGDETFDSPAGTVVFVPDPEILRSGTALADGTLVVAVGGWPDRAYHSLPWEPIYLAQQQMTDGDWAAAAETLEREAGDHRESGAVRYRLACCLARAGDSDRALAELREAIAARPSFAATAANDDHLVSLHQVEGWSDLTS